MHALKDGLKDGLEKRFSRALFAALLLSLIAACASESRGRDDDSGSGANNCPESLGNLNVSEVTALGGVQFCVVRAGSLTQTASLDAGVRWEISGAIEVSNNATLIVEAGARITAADAGSYIYMRAGTTFRAEGDADRPIVFSSTDDGEDGSGEWGGIVIESFMASTTAHRLSYLVIAEAGAPIAGILAGESLAASLTLIGQHENTRLQFLQSHNSAGDGIVMRSEDPSNVNKALMESVLVTAPGNDGIHVNNYSGLIKNLLVINDAGSGRAGIRAGGEDSNPFIINVTLVGNDETLVPGDDEVPLLFDNGFGDLRIANSFFFNYRGNCYAVNAPADLSGVENNVPDPIIEMNGDTVFIDGVHCANSVNPGAVSNLPVAGGTNLRSDLQGLGPNQEGLSSYITATVDFEDADGTAGWFLLSIDGNDNGTNELRRLNGGDTDDNGTSDEPADQAFTPLFNRDEELFTGFGTPEIPATNFSCRAPSELADGFVYFDVPDFDPDDGMDTSVMTDPQPDPASNELACGFIFVPAQPGDFNLTVIGAVESASDDRFDGWTLEGSF